MMCVERDSRIWLIEVTSIGLVLRADRNVLVLMCGYTPTSSVRRGT